MYSCIGAISTIHLLTCYKAGSKRSSLKLAQNPSFHSELILSSSAGANLARYIIEFLVQQLARVVGDAKNGIELMDPASRRMIKISHVNQFPF